MEQYIPKSVLVAEIERWIELLTNEKNQEGASQIDKLSLGGRIAELQEVKTFIDTLEVKEIEENKLPNPRFPHLNNIIDKVFGTGNLESFEYEEAEQLVLLAKEELLKDLEVKEVDLEKAIDDYIYTHDGRKRLALELDWKCCNLTLKGGDEIIKFAKHFFELGFKAQKGE